MKNRKQGFTLVEIMIVVMIIGLLAAIALPGFARARTTAQRNGCINNMRQIEAAKDQYAIEAGLVDAAAVTPAIKTEIDLFIKGGEPNCPAQGDYTYNAIGAPPTCSLAADPNLHVLP